MRCIDDDNNDNEEKCAYFIYYAWQRNKTRKKHKNIERQRIPSYIQIWSDDQQQQNITSRPTRLGCKNIVAPAICINLPRVHASSVANWKSHLIWLWLDWKGGKSKFSEAPNWIIQTVQQPPFSHSQSPPPRTKGLEVVVVVFGYYYRVQSSS